MTTIEINEIREVIDGIEYKFFHNDYGPAFRVFDIDSDEVVGLMNYPNDEMAQDAFRTATAAAWQLAASNTN